MCKIRYMGVEKTKQGNVGKGRQGGIKHRLTPKNKRFCELFATDREFFGNGVQSYIKAYNIDLSKSNAYAGAGRGANRLLKNAKILAYINKLLKVVLNEAHVDKQLAFLITQNVDFKAKMSAIKEFNALRQRVTKKFEGDLNLMVKVVNYGDDKDNTDNGNDNPTAPL